MSGVARINSPVDTDEFVVSTKTSSYTLVSTDKSSKIVMNSSTPTTITVNASIFPSGSVVWIENAGSAVCTITAGSASVTSNVSLELRTDQSGFLFFSSSSDVLFFSYEEVLSCDFVVVAGGGGGYATVANVNGGGGGAGGYRSSLSSYYYNDDFDQVGADINGEAASDKFGHSVALSSDGSRLAVGAPENDGNGSNSGHVRVYDWSGSAWVQVGADINGEAAADQLGFSVALSSDGSRLAAGAPGNDGGGSASGHVRVYDWSGSAWVQVGADINGEAASDNSGWSVALSSDGSRLAVGAPFNDGNGSNSGHVRVYDWSGSAWVQVGADINGEAALDQSGWSVALSSDGSRLAVGAPYNDSGLTDRGQVKVYDWSGSAWVLAGVELNGSSGDLLGFSVALSSDGSRLAAGAPGDDDGGADSGRVLVYDWTGTTWSQDTSLYFVGDAAGDQLGHSVALSSDGSRVAAGAPFNDGNGSNSGHVKVFAFVNYNWAKLGSNIEGDGADDQFGKSVALSGDSSILAAGAIFSDGGATDSGSVRAFERGKQITVSGEGAPLKLVKNFPYNVTIGAGGAYADKWYKGQGTNSWFGSILCLGGGVGTYTLSANSGAFPVSGSGGGGSTNVSGGSGTSGQGNNGGSSTGSNSGGAGGGGAAKSGSSTASFLGGNGGAGLCTTITGTEICLAGGGGGIGDGSYPPGLGGNGGGGGINNLGLGLPNTGGGGRGGSVYFSSGAGGSGIVILRVPDSVNFTVSSGVNYTEYNPSGYKVIAITGTSTTAETITFY